MSATMVPMKKTPQGLPMSSSGTGLPRIEGYVLQQLIGVGGMGMVYRGIQEGLERPVAIKMLQVQQRHANNRVRFLEEGRAIARLQHPSIIQVYDSGEQADLTYLVMELIEGGNLQQLLLHGPLAIRQTAELVRKLALAVDHAHQAGILHRDLKPANVLLSTENDQQELSTQDSTLRTLVPKITDFGLARQLDHSVRLTISGQFVGTPQYMAPEQIRSEATVKQAVDIYALGAILYECLTGQPPFEGKKELEIGWKILQQPPVPPQRIRSEVPTDLQTICLKCLAKEPSSRYGSARALAEDLGRYLAGLPIQARPLSYGQRAWLWCWRNPLVATLTMVIFLTMALGMFSTSYFWWRAEEANRQLKIEYLLSHWIEMGRTQRSNGNYPEAREYFRQAIALYEKQLAASPGSAPMLSGLAGCWEALGRVSLSSREYEQAAEEIQKAIGIQQKALTLMPRSSLYTMFLDTHHRLLGGLYRDQERWEELLETLRERQQLLHGQSDQYVQLAENAAELAGHPRLPAQRRADFVNLAFSCLQEAVHWGIQLDEVQQKQPAWQNLVQDPRWHEMIQRGATRLSDHP